MTVFDNVAFGLKMRKLDKETIRRDVMEMLRLVDLEGFENRYPREMSGCQPRAWRLPARWSSSLIPMLFDEPLSNLDAKLRVKMRDGDSAHSAGAGLYCDLASRTTRKNALPSATRSPS